MARRGTRIPKTTPGKLSDLDDHLYLLRLHLCGLRQDAAHLKALSAELRALVCLAGGTEGLLWRLVDELKVSDSVHLHLAGKVNTGHPIAHGLHFAVFPIARAGYGHPKLRPCHYSLREVIREAEAVFVGGSSITHENLIRAVAEQMGTAHEDDGIDLSLAQLQQVFLNGVAPYVPVLATDADLTLQVGERVLDQAEANSVYRRKARTGDLGNVSIVARLGLWEPLRDQRSIFTFASHVSEVEISCLARPTELAFVLTKRGVCVREMVAPFPADWELHTDAVFAFSYASGLRQAMVVTSHSQAAAPVDCDLGWLAAPEVTVTELSCERDKLVYLQFLAVFARLVTPQECEQFRKAAPPPADIGAFGDEGSAPRPFPQ